MSCPANASSRCGKSTASSLPDASALEEGAIIASDFPPLLVAGFHALTLSELQRLCVADFPESRTRRNIMSGLTDLVERLNGAGVVGELWINGSFVTQKPDPADVDILLHVFSSIYDFDGTKRSVIDWASAEARLETHYCDAYKWVEYDVGHPLYTASEEDRLYWSAWYGRSRAGVRKGIAVIQLPAATP